jgi:hypothetical protein
MILAKYDNGENIVYGIKTDPTRNIELNPLLENYFMVHNLVSNNLRHILTGSEINHPIKSLNKFDFKSDLSEE